MIYKLITENTIDEHILNMAAQKKELSECMLEEGAYAAGSKSQAAKGKGKSRRSDDTAAADDDGGDEVDGDRGIMSSDEGEDLVEEETYDVFKRMLADLVSKRKLAS